MTCDLNTAFGHRLIYSRQAATFSPDFHSLFLIRAEFSFTIEGEYALRVNHVSKNNAG